MTQIPRLLLIAIFTSVISWGCGPRPPQDDSSTTDIAACSGLFGKAYNDCVTTQAGGPKKKQDQVYDFMAQGVASQAEIIVGAPHAIKYAGDYRDCTVLEQHQGGSKQCGNVNSCLALVSNRIVWEPCSNYRIEQQFHFIQQVGTRFRFPGVSHESSAFRIVPRADLKREYRQNYKCLKPVSGGLTLTKCTDAPYFMTLMSKFDDDQDHARKVENKFVSLVALGPDITKKISNFVETETRKASDDIFLDLDLNSNDAEEFREKNAVRATSKFLDLGDFSEIKSCSSLQIIVNIDGKVATKCPAQNLREEQNGSPNNHVFVHHCSGRMIDNAADCSGLDPIKNYYDFLEARTWGPVVKVSPKGEKHICLETQGRSLREISHCDKNSVDNPGIQFRLEPAIDQQMTNGKGKVRLRSVQNPTLCADLAGDKLVDCRQAPRLTFDPLANDLLIKKGDKWQSYFTTMCLVATSHKKSARYDCQKEIPWQYALYEKLSVGLGFVPYVGPLFSAVFDGILCGSNEEDYAVNGCIGLGLDLSLGIFFGDYIPLGQLGAATFKLASKTGTLAKTGINSASAAIQMVVQKAALRNGLTPAVARKSMFWMNDVVIDALKERDFSLKDLNSVFEKLKASNACAGAPCRMWWNPTADDTKEYVNQLRNYVSRSKMSAADKATVLEKLK